MDLSRIAARIAEQLTLRDVQGDTSDYEPSPASQAVMGRDPKFKDFIREKLGLAPDQEPEYDEVIRVLLEEGLDESAAQNYALLAGIDVD